MSEDIGVQTVDIEKLESQICVSGITEETRLALYRELRELMAPLSASKELLDSPQEGE